MKFTIILVAILCAIIIGIGFFVVPQEGAPDLSSSETPAAPWEAKTDDQASVTVTITPLDISPESPEWRFNIVMDTHSVELDEDVTKVAVLVDDRGKAYTPLAWQGTSGGHHREGILVFSPLTPKPESIELKISGIGGVMRSFSWRL